MDMNFSMIRKMTLMASLLMIGVLILTKSIECAGEVNEHSMETRQIRYCGTDLADMLSFVCNGIFFTPSPKRNIKPELEGVDGDDKISFKKNFDKRFRSLLQVRRGAYDECCRVPCTRETLESYCG